jgi:regulator of nucleoside diphosphate kinase
MEKRIVLSQHDVLRLRAFMRNTRSSSALDREHRRDLQDEIERAITVEAPELPADVVAIDSKVLVRDTETSLATVYTVVLPAQADPAKGRISVFAPLGTALLGYQVNDVIEWWMPGGLRRLKIEAVEQLRQSPDDPQPQRKEKLAA